MRILVLVAHNEHPHNYGVDYLIDGFREVCGAENVLEWPEKNCLHLAPGQPRDACNIDSDAWWPSKGEINVQEWAETADLVVLGDVIDEVETTIRAANVLRVVPISTPVLALDMSDYPWNRVEEYQRITDRPLIYAKRELPIGETWAIPCPLTYPASKIPHPMPAKMPKVVYHATHHADFPPGIPRMAIVAALQAHPHIPPSALDVALYPSQQNRPTPEEYHAKMARGLVGIAFNGAPNWDNNRFSEGLAHGLCQVSERPRIEYPHPYQHLRHVCWIDTADQVAPMVAALINNPTWALSIANAGHEHFKQYHCSAARARYLLQRIGLMKEVENGGTERIAG